VLLITVELRESVVLFYVIWADSILERETGLTSCADRNSSSKAFAACKPF